MVNDGEWLRVVNGDGQSMMMVDLWGMIVNFNG